MSLKSVREILDLAGKDEDFCNELIANPAKTLSHYELTDQERRHFAHINIRKIKIYSNNLESRLSKDGSGEGDWWVDSVTD